jgi:hypothetical protein
MSEPLIERKKPEKAKICAICGKPILAGESWMEWEGKPVHVNCLWEVWKPPTAPSAGYTYARELYKKGILRRQEAEIVSQMGIRICPVCGEPIDIMKEKAVYDPETGRWYHKKCWEKVHGR